MKADKKQPKVTPQTAGDLDVNASQQVTQPGEDATINNPNGRKLGEKKVLKFSDGRSTQARDNDSDTANGLLRFNDNDDATQTPEVTEKFMNESVTKEKN